MRPTSRRLRRRKAVSEASLRGSGHSSSSADDPQRPVEFFLSGHSAQQSRRRKQPPLCQTKCRPIPPWPRLARRQLPPARSRRANSTGCCAGSRRGRELLRHHLLHRHRPRLSGPLRVGSAFCTNGALHGTRKPVRCQRDGDFGSSSFVKACLFAGPTRPPEFDTLCVPNA
jgi:hypothetical protein